MKTERLYAQAQSLVDFYALWRFVCHPGRGLLARSGRVCRAAGRILSQADGIYLALLTQVSLSNGIETSWTPPDEAGSIGEVLDRVQLAARARVEYAFQVLEVIEGDEQETLQIAMPFRRAVGNVSDFSGHTDPDFWTNPQSGRAMIGGDCRVVTDFQLGATYVLITSDVWHLKSFERVQSPDDRFYRYLLDRSQAE